MLKKMLDKPLLLAVLLVGLLMFVGCSEPSDSPTDADGGQDMVHRSDDFSNGWPSDYGEIPEDMEAHDGFISITGALNWTMFDLKNIRDRTTIYEFEFENRFRFTNNDGNVYFTVAGVGEQFRLMINETRVIVNYGTAAGDWKFAPIVESPIALQQNQWYTAMIKFKDGHMIFVCDDVELQYEHPGFTPNWYYFGQSGNRAFDLDYTMIRALSHR